MAAAGEAKVVEAAMVGTTIEATAMAEAVEAAEAMRMEAAMEAVVWDTAETAARRPIETAKDYDKLRRAARAIRKTLHICQKASHLLVPMRVSGTRELLMMMYSLVYIILG